MLIEDHKVHHNQFICQYDTLSIKKKQGQAIMYIYNKERQPLEIQLRYPMTEKNSYNKICCMFPFLATCLLYIKSTLYDSSVTKCEVIVQVLPKMATRYALGRYIVIKLKKLKSHLR